MKLKLKLLLIAPCALSFVLGCYLLKESFEDVQPWGLTSLSVYYAAMNCFLTSVILFTGAVIIQFLDELRKQGG